MAEDVSAEVAGNISGSKVFGGSENIRHGKYKMLIRRIFAQKVEIDEGEHKMAFWELTPLESKPNPQIEGDHVDYPGNAGPLKDDGMHPNPVGSNCALKVDFDGPGARSAGSNIKSAILGLFGKRDGEIPDSEINKTWIDLARVRPLKVGDAIGIDSTTNQPIFSKVEKAANPACGMIIYCETLPKRKKKPNDKGAYVTKLLWSCGGSPAGVGENAPDLVAKRRAEIEAATPADDEEETSSPPAPYAAPAAPAAPAVAVAPPPPPAPPAPPAPTAEFTPVKPWEWHPSQPKGPTPETQWLWSNPAHGGNNAIKSVAQLRTGQ
jgi:hypothetical protein